MITREQAERLLAETDRQMRRESTFCWEVAAAVSRLYPGKFTEEELPRVGAYLLQCMRVSEALLKAVSR